MHTHLSLNLTCIVSITSNPSQCTWTWTHQGCIDMAELGPVEAPVIPHGHASISTSAKPKTVAPLAAPVPLTSYPSLLPKTSLGLNLTSIIGSASNASRCAQTWTCQGRFGTVELSPVEAPVIPHDHASISTLQNPPSAALVPPISYPSSFPNTSLSLDLTSIVGSASNASRCTQTWTCQGCFSTALLRLLFLMATHQYLLTQTALLVQCVIR